MGLQRSHQRSRDKERVSATMERPQRHDIVLGSDAEELARAQKLYGVVTRMKTKQEGASG